MNWTENFFNQEYLNTHLPILTDEINNKDVDFIEDVLELKNGEKILDLPCGFGRHSNILAQRGYQVTGIDNQKEFIEIAKFNSNKSGINQENITYINEDMRDINFDKYFDAVINFFTSFGYFDDEVNFIILQKISESLKYKGKFLIEILNRDFVVEQTRNDDQVWLLYPDNRVFMSKNKFDIINSRWLSDQIIVTKGKATKQFQNVRLYTYTEFKYLLNKVGMKITKTYGSIDKTEYSVNSRSMIIVAEKII